LSTTCGASIREGGALPADLNFLDVPQPHAWMLAGAFYSP